MYTDLEIDNFRSIAHLQVRGLSRINLIVGRNNSGKTSLLEAIFLLGGGADARLPSILGQLRGQPVDPRSMDVVWRPLFHELRPDRKVILHGHWQNEPCVRMLEIGVTPVSLTQSLTTTTMPPHGSNGVGTALPRGAIAGLTVTLHSPAGSFQADAFVDEGSGQVRATSHPAGSGVPTTLLSARAFSSPARDAQQFSQALREKLDTTILEAIRLIEPAIQRIEVLSEAGGPTVYVDSGLDSLIPLAVCGEGLTRLFSIAVEMLAVRGGVLLIDEIDNGLHHSVLPQLWGLVRQLCERHQVQVFATTHNEELLFSALAAFAAEPGELGLFRIDRRDGQHTAAAYDAEMREAVREHHFEVRG
jgi:hypothetical protein